MAIPPLRAALRSRRKTIGRLVLGLEPGQQHGGRPLQVGVADLHVRARPRRRPGTAPPRPSAGGPAGRCRCCPGRSGRTWRRRRRPRAVSRPPVSTPARPRAAARPAAAASSASGQEAGASTPAFVAYQRGDQPVRLGGVGERPAALVAVPLLVDLGVAAGQPAGDLAPPGVGALAAARGAVLADAGRGDQVEGPGPEPVGGAGQRPDRADLHRVAGEVGVERHAVGGADELVRAPLEELDERVPGDLLGEPGAAGARRCSAPGRAGPRWRSRPAWGRSA